MPVPRCGALALLLTFSAVVLGQEPPPRPAPQQKRLGAFFWHDSPNDERTFAGIREGFAAAGVDVDFVVHRAGGDPAQATAGLAALRDARCELVFALGTQAALLAKTALTEVPVVFAAVSDPVASGVLTDWRGSGSNLCGASNWIAPANVLAVFRLAVPNLRRLGVLRSTTAGVVSAAEVATLRAHLATEPGTPVELREATIRGEADLERAVQGLLAEGIDALWIPIDLDVYRHTARIQELLGGQRVVLVSTAAAGIRNGALVGTTVDYRRHGQRAALLALRVLRGAAPGSLPVDRLQSNLVIVNLAAARRARAELPLSLLALADELLDPELPNAPR